MSVETNRTPTEQQLSAPGTESSDPDYLAWRDEKVRYALEQSQRFPERRKPQAEVWKKFGLEP